MIRTAIQGKLSFPSGGELFHGRVYLDHQDMMDTFAELKRNGVKHIINLQMEADEEITMECQNFNLIHIPIDDFSVPTDNEAFNFKINCIVKLLKAGEKAFMHCMAGHGRTGMVMAIVYAKMNNVDSYDAMKVSRKECYGPENPLQVNFVKRLLGDEP
jgi:protein-tyrosine phosphatase